jgi:hypothetical protein
MTAEKTDLKPPTLINNASFLLFYHISTLILLNKNRIKLSARLLK